MDWEKPTTNKDWTYHAALALSKVLRGQGIKARTITAKHYPCKVHVYVTQDATDDDIRILNKKITKINMEFDAYWNVIQIINWMKTED